MNLFSGESVSILHVDDDPGFLDVTSELLERENQNFEISTATTASEGLERIDDENVECVVSDYEMPRIDGLEFLETVRETRPELPFILFTGKGSEEIASEAVSAGVTDYLQKAGGTHQYTVLANRISNYVSKYRAERETRATKDRFSKLLEESADFIFTVDAEGAIQYVTPSVERVMGYPSDDLLGNDGFENVHPEDLDTAIEGFSEVVETPHGEATVEFRSQHRDGSWRWLEVRGRNLLDDPVIEGIVVNVRDITERKEREQRLRDERDRRAVLFENASVPIVDVRFDDGIPTIKAVNSAFEGRFGYDGERIAGKPVSEILVPEGRQDHHRERSRQLLAGEDIEREVHCRTATGVQTFTLCITPIERDEGVVGAWASFTESTEESTRDNTSERRTFVS